MAQQQYYSINLLGFFLKACLLIYLAANTAAYSSTSKLDSLEPRGFDELEIKLITPRSYNPTDPNTTVTIISAHHDDEVLWFLPWLDIADKIITPTVYPTSEYMKSHIAQKYMSTTKWIPLQGETDHNTAKYIAHDRDYRQEHITNAYLSDLLESHIIASDVIISHSPWGEYGHEQHRQLYCVLQELIIKHNKDFYIWNGSPDVRQPIKGYPINYFMLKKHGSELPYVMLSIDRPRYDEIRNIFIQAELVYPKSPAEKFWNYRFWTWDRPYESGGASIYNPPEVGKFYKIFNHGTPLYDYAQIQGILQLVPVFPDDRENANCLFNPPQTP